MGECRSQICTVKLVAGLFLFKGIWRENVGHRFVQLSWQQVYFCLRGSDGRM